jgi:hypothetical protein
MLAKPRLNLHQFLHAECDRCGFSVDGEIRNGCGGWKDYSWNDFSRQCNYRTPAGKPTFVCPHLRAAKIKSRPIVYADEARADGNTQSRPYALAAAGGNR